jgi:hypothetical protein
MRTLPERTADAFLSSYLAHRFPLLRLWAPTSGWDFALRPASGYSGKVALLENKGAEDDGSGGHVIPIWRDQLLRYLLHPLSAGALYYILPVPPWSGVPRIAPPPLPVGAPAAPPTALPLIPAEARYIWRCGGWMYAISGWLLAAHIVSASPSLRFDGRFVWLPANDLLAATGGRRSLAEFACALEQCVAGRRAQRGAAAGRAEPSAEDRARGFGDLDPTEVLAILKRLGGEQAPETTAEEPTATPIAIYLSDTALSLGARA